MLPTQMLECVDTLASSGRAHHQKLPKKLVRTSYAREVSASTPHAIAAQL